MSNKKLLFLAGDGIGPEIMNIPDAPKDPVRKLVGSLKRSKYMREKAKDVNDLSKDYLNWCLEKSSG